MPFVAKHYFYLLIYNELSCFDQGNQLPIITITMNIITTPQPSVQCILAWPFFTVCIKERWQQVNFTIWSYYTTFVIFFYALNECNIIRSMKYHDHKWNFTIKLYIKNNLYSIINIRYKSIKKIDIKELNFKFVSPFNITFPISKENWFVL